MIRWEGVTVATSSISHGGETLGQVQYLRRERILTPGGATEIPLISGNTARGRLRDTGAQLWWDDAGRPKLPPAAVHTIFSGGTLTKSAGEPLSGARLAEVKHLCPPVDVFGAAGGGRIIDGRLAVGKMVPICREAAGLVPERFLPDGGRHLPDVWDITGIEWYSKRGDPDVDAPPARFGIETFPAGTRFYWWLTLDRPSDRSASFFADTLNRFTAPGAARVGGNLRAGLGNLAVELAVTAGTPPAAGLWARRGAPLDAAEVEALSWLG